MQYFHAIIASLILHLIIVSFVDKYPDPNSQKKVPIEVVYEKLPEENTPQQIVRRAPSPEEKKIEKKKKSRFLSDKTTRVKEETRTLRLGPTNNSRSGGGRPQPKRGEIADRFAPTFNPMPLPGPPQMPSTRDLLPGDVKVGQFNSLNTDRHLFFSFYSRFEDQAFPRLQMGLRDLDIRDPRVLKAGQWNLMIEILLDPQGNFIDTVIHQKSIVPEFDRLAQETFRRAAPYRNPPHEMVKEDGRIHLLYQITVFVRPP
jgi:hypothetical protein